MLGIEGRSLHSYLYVWAQRARAAGMPEREAMNHLGHESRAIHAAYAAYAGGATVATLPLEILRGAKTRERHPIHDRGLETARKTTASRMADYRVVVMTEGDSADRCRQR